MRRGLTRGGFGALAGFALLIAASVPARAAGSRAAPADGPEASAEHAPVAAGRALPASQARIREDELVLGVVAGSAARAYPVKALWGEAGHTVNDELGDESLAVAFCPLAGVGASFSRRRGGRTLQLGSLAAVERGSLVLYDAGSHSRYRLLTGEAFFGPRAGERLRRVPTLFTTWARWRSLHPRTTVYAAPDASGGPSLDAARLRRIILSGGLLPADRDWIVGVEGRSEAAAFAVRPLAERRVVNVALEGRPLVVFLSEDLTTAVVWERSSKGRTLSFSASGDRLVDAETRSAWDPFTGRALAGPLKGRSLRLVPSLPGFWHAWKAEHPDSAVHTSYAE